MVNARTIYLVENLRFLSFLLCEGETRVNFLPSVPVNLVQLFIYIFYLDQSRRINNTLSSIPADNVLYFSGSLSLIMFFSSIGSGSVLQFYALILFIFSKVSTCRLTVPRYGRVQPTLPACTSKFIWRTCSSSSASSPATGSLSTRCSCPV